MPKSIVWFVMILLIVVMLVHRVKGQSQLSPSYREGDSSETVMCDFFKKLWILRPQINIPIPFKVLMFQNVQSAQSPLLKTIQSNDRCVQWKNSNVFYWLHNRGEHFWSTILLKNYTNLSEINWKLNLDMTGSLIILECAEDYTIGFTDCSRILKLLAEVLKHHQLISKRMFFVILVYQRNNQGTQTLFLQIVRTFLQYKRLDKTHAAVVSINWQTDRNQLIFERVGYVRPLKNICLFKEEYFEELELNAAQLVRHLLAIDSYDQVIKCDFHNSTLKAVVVKVNFKIRTKLYFELFPPYF